MGCTIRTLVIEGSDCVSHPEGSAARRRRRRNFACVSRWLLQEMWKSVVILLYRLADASARARFHPELGLVPCCVPIRILRPWSSSSVTVLSAFIIVSSVFPSRPTRIETGMHWMDNATLLLKQHGSAWSHSGMNTGSLIYRAFRRPTLHEAFGNGMNRTDSVTCYPKPDTQNTRITNNDGKPKVFLRIPAMWATTELWLWKRIENMTLITVLNSCFTESRCLWILAPKLISDLFVTVLCKVCRWMSSSFILWTEMEIWFGGRSELEITYFLGRK